MAKKKFRRRNKNLLALAVSSLAIIYYLIELDTRPMHPASNSDSSAAATPQSSSSGLTVRHFKRDGTLNYTLTSARVDYYRGRTARHAPHGDFDEHQNEGAIQIGAFQSARMQQPVIALQGDKKPRLTLTANSASVDDNGSKAELLGNVKIVDHLDGRQLTTEALTLDGALQQVLTQQRVTLLTPQSETRATGLQGNLTEQRWQLLSEVDSVIRPR